MTAPRSQLAQSLALVVLSLIWMAVLVYVAVVGMQ